MELIQGVDVNFVMPSMLPDMFQKGLSTATESAVTLSTVREMMYFTKKREVIFDLPRPLRPKVPDGPLQSTPHPGTQMATSSPGLFP